MTEREFSRMLGWPGYKVYRHEMDELKRTLRLWVRRKLGHKILIRGKCGGRAERVAQMPGKAPCRKDFEDKTGLACPSAPARQVARRFSLAPGASSISTSRTC
jgi:hypothetical protein